MPCSWRCPGLVSAQGGARVSSANLSPTWHFGAVVYYGLPVGEGTIIVAIADEQKLESTMIIANGKFGPLDSYSPSAVTRWLAL